MAFQFTEENTTDVEALKAQLAYRQALQEITNELNLAEDLEPVLDDLKDRILSLFNSERMTIYLIDTKSQELFSQFKIGTELSEIRIPISTSSIAGYAASIGRTLNVADVYDEAEIKALHLDLEFDKSWDEKSDYRTTQVLTAPMQVDGNILGVLQIINRKDGSNFTRDDEGSAQEIAKILAIAFQARQRLAKSRPQVRQARKDVEQILMKTFKISKEDILKLIDYFSVDSESDIGDRQSKPPSKYTITEHEFYIIQRVHSRVVELSKLTDNDEKYHTVNCLLGPIYEDLSLLLDSVREVEGGAA